MALTKPLVDSATWGNTNTASPDMVTPGAGLVNTGFLAPPTLPKRGHMNWLLNKLHQGLRYYMAQGVPAWDASETNYAVGSQVTFGALGYICKSLPVAGTNPTLDTAHWGLQVPVQPGTLLRKTALVGTSMASAAGCARARGYMLGGGAGGAGVQAFGTSSAGGGGAAGGYLIFETTTIPGTWNYVLGAGGTGGTAAPTLGTDGGNTTLSDGALTYTARGGHAPAATWAGGLPPALSTNGQILNASGMGGLWAPNDVNGALFSGAGGSSAMGGAGGPGVSGALLSGLVGVGPGAGGSGGFATGGSSTTGGAGTAGIIILEEFA